MDVTFKCPHCDQELEIEASNAGSEIDCPACGQKLVIPQPDNVESLRPPAPPPTPQEEKHFSVPQRDKAPDSLIGKPLTPLDVAAKEGIKLRIKTIRHSDCVEVGKDHFDEAVTNFLSKVGDTNLVSIHPITYSHQDLGSREWVADYGVMIIYNG